jgi:glycosyltransferase involved in cell wall biosynthesis
MWRDLDLDLEAEGDVKRWPIYVVIPALNEEHSLPLVLADLAALPLDISEVVVVDNGSRDNTAQVARHAGASVLHEAQRGYGAACQCALRRVAQAALACGAEDAVVVFLDADYSDYPEDLGSLIEPIVAGSADFVVGSRLRTKDAKAAVPLASRVGNRIACAVLAALYGVSFSDLGPFRAISLSALMQLEMRDRSWGWTVEMQLRACQQQLAVREVPVRYRARHAGQSKISGSLWGGVRAGAKILWILTRHIAQHPGHSLRAHSRAS